MVIVFYIDCTKKNHSIKTMIITRKEKKKREKRKRKKKKRKRNTRKTEENLYLQMKKFRTQNGR